MPTLVLTAGVVLVHASKPRRYLLLRAYRNWDFPKGVVEPGEAPEAAALRELAEETGLAQASVRLVTPTPYTTEPYRSSHAGKACLKQAQFYLCAFAGDPGSVRLSREHQEARWTSRDAALRLLVPRLGRVLTALDDSLSRA